MPDPGMEPVSPPSPALAGGFFTTELLQKPAAALDLILTQLHNGQGEPLSQKSPQISLPLTGSSWGFGPSPELVLHIQGNRDHPQASGRQQEEVSAEQEAGTERKEQG